MAKETIRDLMDAMEIEAACLDAYAEGQRGFSASLRGRDWPALESAILFLEGLARRLAELENSRAGAEACLRAMTGCREDGFYRLALAVPEPDRSGLLDLHRRLRVAAMRVRIENSQAGEYAEGARRLLGSVLEELFPEKKGRIYGKNGAAREPGADALVLNAAF